MSATVTVTEDVTVKLQTLGPIDVNDTLTVTEDVTPKLICNIRPVTITDIQLWSKLNSASDVTSPTNGTGGAEVGSPTYIAGKFGNGISSDATENGCTFPCASNSIDMDKGTIECWWKPNFNQAVDTNRIIWNFVLSIEGGLKFSFAADQDDLKVDVWANGGYKFSIATNELTWSASDLIHLAVTWDCTGTDIGGSKTIALYVDNVEKASSTTTWVAGSEADTDLSIYNMDAVVDNLKTYDVCKTDFSHKETEGISSGPVETVTVSESVSMAGVFNVSLSDNVIVTDVDAVQLLTLFNLAVNDSLIVTEDVSTPKLSYRPSVYDLVTLTELVSSVASLADISVSDNVTVTESIVPCLINLISTHDSVTLSELVSGVASIGGISVYDAVTIIEKLWMDLWMERDKETDIWVERTKENDEDDWIERTKEDDDDAWDERENKETG